MKKAIVIILMLLLLGGCVTFGILWMNRGKEVEAANAQNAALQMQIANIQNQHQEEKIETVGVYKFKNNIPTGAEITAEDVELVYVAAASYTESFLKDVEKLPAMAARPCYANTIVESNDLSYDSYVVDKKFTRELTFESMPVGLQSGEFVDIRLAMPNGEIYNVMSHLYLEYVAGSTIMFKVSEEEWMIIDSALRDNAVYPSTTHLFLVRYLDPGADTSIAFYPVSTELATFLTFSPNIKDTTRLINPSLRNHIDEVLTLYSTDANSAVASAYISALKSQLGSSSAVNDAIIDANTDPETEEYKAPDFLYQDGSSIVDQDAFTDKVDDAIGDLEDSIADFEQAIQ